MSKYLSSKEAAEYIGYSDQALRRGRSIGKLAGVKPPASMKRGWAVLYKKETLDSWLAQFEEVEG